MRNEFFEKIPDLLLIGNYYFKVVFCIKTLVNTNDIEIV